MCPAVSVRGDRVTKSQEEKLVKTLSPVSQVPFEQG